MKNLLLALSATLAFGTLAAPVAWRNQRSRGNGE